MRAQTLRRSATRPAVTTDLPALVQRLAAIVPARHRILSCYVRLEPRDRIRDNYLIAFKNRMKGLRADPMMSLLPREERVAVERDLNRILRYLGHTRDLPQTPGLAIFACEELGLLALVCLTRVHRTRLVLDDTPWISELVASEPGTSLILAVVVDRAHARFFEITSGGSEELPGLVSGSTRGGKFHSDRADSPGWGELDYHRRLEEEHRRHYADIVQRLQGLVQSRPTRGILIAGPTDHTSGLVRFLPERLAEQVLGTARLNPTAVDIAELRDVALAVAHEHDRKQLAAELEALNDAVGSGWAVNGPRETLGALHRGRVRTLFVRENLEGPGFRCSVTGRLVLAKGDCLNEGHPQPVRDLVDESIEEALRQRVRVVVLPEGAEAESVDGLAATLRFR